ncbi:hypothetical protein MMC31_001365 [Peltigera leucophlebia]|nr:hypothetical protein [Peltigera leucophlebia]
MVFFWKSGCNLLAVSLLVTIAVALPDTSKPVNPRDYSPADVIIRDVLIIGGGSSGTYSAIKLRDLGKSVAVVEAKGVLGGHTETWTDPVTKGKVDIGVINFHDNDLVRKYFGRYQIPLTKADHHVGVTKYYYNFRTGKNVPDYAPYPNFTTYATQLAKYPYLEDGFDLPESVPEDLVLSSVVGLAQGVGDILNLPTIYIFKYISLSVLENLQVGLLTTARHNNHELYDKALAELGHDALLNSSVLAIDRNYSGQHATILIQTSRGKKLVFAKNILITIPPLLDNLKHFDLNDEERSIFAKFKYAVYYAAVLRNNVIPANLSLEAIDPSRPYNIPNLPKVYSFNPTRNPGLTDVKYVSTNPLPLEQVKADIIKSAKLSITDISGNVSSSNSTSAKFEVTVLSAHSPFELHVDADAIREGYYKKLYALQGKGRFWYTGAAFNVHDSSSLWQFSEKVVARIVSG